MPLAITSVHTKIPLQHNTRAVSSHTVAVTRPKYCRQVSPFLRSKFCKDLVPLVFHLPVDAVNGDFLYQRLQGSSEVLDTRTRADEETPTETVLGAATHLNLIHPNSSH